MNDVEMEESSLGGNPLRVGESTDFSLMHFEETISKKLLGGNFILIMTLNNLAEFHRDFKT